MQDWAPGTIFTIGHSTRSVEEFIALLRQVAVDFLVDIRSMPRSRTNPQFNSDAFAETLRQAGIGYRHVRALGGLRHRRKDDPPSPNALWRVANFRNSADYAMTTEFRAGLEELEALARAHRCAIMCAEAVWWRCHRRIVADYLLATGLPVAHILGPDHVDEATLTPGAQIQPGGKLVYPGETDLLL